MLALLRVPPVAMRLRRTQLGSATPRRSRAMRAPQAAPLIASPVHWRLVRLLAQPACETMNSDCVWAV